MDGIIKTTAKFQEAEGPLKQRPIIQIEKALPTVLVRPSIDSGRDNPFRPDGEIYRSVDPIVDYYRLGLNPSRTQSAASSQADGDSTGAAEQQVGRKQRQSGQPSEARSCWRTWFCCRCFRSAKRQQRAHQQSPSEVTNTARKQDEEADEEILQFLRNKELEAADELKKSVVKEPSIATHLPPRDTSRAREKFFSETAIISLNGEEKSTAITTEDRPAELEANNSSHNQAKPNRCIVS